MLTMEYECETGSKGSLWGFCNAIGCSNGRRKIAEWEAEECSIHIGSKHNSGKCICPPPFILWTFPTERKDSQARKQWIRLVNRSNWTANEKSRLCSRHFIDGKPTPEHPYPTENLGYNPGLVPPVNNNRMDEELSDGDSPQSQGEKQADGTELSDVEVQIEDEDGIDLNTTSSQQTDKLNKSEPSEEHCTTLAMKCEQSADVEKSKPVVQKKRPRGRPKGSGGSPTKRAAVGNKKCKTESTGSENTEAGLPAEHKPLDNVAGPTVKTEQPTPKVGRIIKKPKIFSPDFDMTTPKRNVRRGRRSLAECETDSAETTGDSAIKKRKDVNPKWLLPFQNGWRREIVLRNTYGEKKARPADVYYYSPHGGSKLRSIPEICRHLRETNSKVTSDCFTFIKELIHEEPAEVVRYASKHKKPFQKSAASENRDASDSAAVEKPSENKDMTGLKSEPKSIPQMTESAVSVTTSSSTSADLGDTATAQVSGSLTSTGASSVTMTERSEASEHNDVRHISQDMKNTLRQAVAKKHTAKRSHSSQEEKAANGSVGIQAKKYKTGNGQRLCGMDCPGRHGVPPSLHCNVCMCMFHPECIGKQSLQRFDGFVCKSCRVMNKKLRDMPSNVSVPLPGPPPLQMSPSPNSAFSCAPPPLRAAPTVGGLDGLRAPPPLRMAPVSSLPPVVPSPVALSSVVRLPTMQLPSVVPDMGNSQPINMLASVSLSTAITAPDMTPVPSDLVIPMPAQAASSLALAAVVPKDVNGQVLALPKNITDRLNLAKPISIKVNNHNFVVPANCFMKTQDGAKVYLPDGSLPENFTQGTASPLSLTLSDNQENCGQVIGVSNCTSKNGEDSAESQMQVRKSRQLNLRQCHIQHLHVGFDCMMLIFKHLNLRDLLRASEVCKTWKNVAAHKHLWQKISFRGCRILNWEKAARKLRDMHTEILDLRGIRYGNEFSNMWSQFMAVLPYLTYIQHIDFGHCPSNLLHSVTEKLQHLEGVTAEFITDTVQEPEMWSVTVKLDIGKFSHLKELKMLKLRGVCGMMLPTFSFSGGLSELGKLTKLKTLSLTTLREIPEYEFSFLGALLELEELELGDIQCWKSETYEQLAKLSKLRTLRLESGTDYEEGGLGEALLALEKLTNLELIKYTVSGSLVKNLANVKSLKTLSIWPDTETQQPAVVNTCTIRAVSDMKSLVQLEWGIMVEQSSSNTPEGSTDSNDSMTGDKERCNGDSTIPFFPANFDLSKVEENRDHLDNTLEHLTVSQLVNRLSDFLPDTKIRVFKVPIISVSKT